jgi:hypothetical protein
MSTKEVTMTARLNDERSKVVGLASLTDAEGWIKVGEVGLDKLVAKSDVTLLTFGELAEKYLSSWAHSNFTDISARDTD